MQAWVRQGSEGRKRRLPSPQAKVGGNPPRRGQAGRTASRLTRLVLEEQDSQARQQTQEQDNRQDQEALLRPRPLRPAALSAPWPAEVHLGKEGRRETQALQGREAAARSATGRGDVEIPSSPCQLQLPEPCPGFKGDRKTARHPPSLLRAAREPKQELHPTLRAQPGPSETGHALSWVPGATSCLG